MDCTTDPMTLARKKKIFFFFDKIFSQDIELSACVLKTETYRGFGREP